MGSQSKIEWTEATWNPVVGCSVLSEGCTNCYAMRLAHRLAAMGQSHYDGLTRVSGGRPKWTGELRLNRSVLRAPLDWKKGRLIFVNSMSDLFHEKVPLSYIREVFAVMEATPQHTYQVLTKRPERLLGVAGNLPWPQNVWVGTSVENALVQDRIDILREVPAHVRFLSVEPLLGPLENLRLDGIHWVIVGGESGPGARPMDKNWVLAVRDQCVESGVPFHFKQWGGVNKKKTGRILEGRTWDEQPQSMAA